MTNLHSGTGCAAGAGAGAEKFCCIAAMAFTCAIGTKMTSTYTQNFISTPALKIEESNTHLISQN
jgi:hypothetical protein